MAPQLYSRLQKDFDYQPSPDAHDELLGDDNAVRAPWRYLIESLTSLGPNELLQRQSKAASLLRDDGATYKIYDSQLLDNSWQLDLLPWVIESSQWSDIEAGLVERAELMNLILKDLYSKRELITRGIVPPEVIFAHKGFLRACQGMYIPGNHQLIIHSADLVRRADGSMCVLADRTQAPSGAGYALENRIVMNRVFPSLFRDSHVHRLSLFFQNLRSKLVDLVPHIATPNIAVLTPGAYNETYFEHSYLANYLGFYLVQSSDLVVRNNFLWMKSLDGLSRVDVILRRVDDYFCDQVELKGDSQLGVPGLLEVLRSGNLVIANPLGSGVLENPALLKYMPAVGRHFLGREPQLESVGTWWCGDAQDLEYIRTNFQELIIKPIFRTPAKNSQVVSELDESQRAELWQRILARPYYFVAQQKILPSHLPVFNQRELKPRPAVLRSFAVAADTSYRIMPGGLTRVGVQEGISMVSNQAGSVSKDTWVLASEPEKQLSLLAGAESDVEVMTQMSGLPSRVVENLFWLGRYAERAEFGLRLIRTLLLLSVETGTPSASAQRLLLEAVLRVSDSGPSLKASGKQLENQSCHHLLPLLLDPLRRSSIIGSIQAMLACADESKEMMTSDSQRVINDIRAQAQQLAANLQSSMFSAPESALSPILTSMLSLSGSIYENMSRGTGWSFLNMGRRLERGLQTVSLIRILLGAQLPDDVQRAVLEALLASAEALVLYRRRYRGKLDVRNVMELMLLDERNPRSLHYQLEKLQGHLADLPAAKRTSRELDPDARHMLECISLLQLGKLSDLCQVDANSQRRATLDQLCTRIYYLLSETYTSFADKYFEMAAAAPQQLLRQNWEQV